MENLSSTSSYLTDEAASTCPLLTPSPPTNALINDEKQNTDNNCVNNTNQVDYELGKVLQDKLADITTPDEDLNDKSSNSQQLNVHKECTEVIGETKSIIQLTYLPKDCDGYFFSIWNWPLIRKLCTWISLSILCASVGIVIGLVYNLPRHCNPKLEWYQHPIVSLTYQSNINEIIEHLRYLNIVQIELPTELDKYEFLQNNFSTMFFNGPYLENKNYQKVFIERQLSDTENLIELDLNVDYLRKVFNFSHSYKHTPWFIWSLNYKNNLSLILMQLMLPGIPKIAYDSTKEPIVQAVLKLRQTSPALYLNSLETNGIKKYNIEFLNNGKNILIFKRWYKRKQSYVFIMNLTNLQQRLDFSKFFYSYHILVRSSVNVSSEFIESNEITLESFEALILKIE